MVWLIDNLLEALGTFGSVAANDPVSPVLLLSSAAILLVSVGILGVLAFGGILSLLTER